MKRTTLFTCSVYPDLTRVWHHFASRHTDATQVDILIYDCGGQLDRAVMAGARVERRPNIEHGLNIDHAVAACRTPLMFLSDDDTFPISGCAEEDAAAALIAATRLAAVSYCPREWWNLTIDGVSHPVVGTSSLVFRPDVVRTEALSFRRVPTRDPAIRNGEEGCYDTGDHLAEQLLRRRYGVSIPPAAVRRSRVLGYSGVSRGFLRYARWAGGRAGWTAALHGPALEADLVELAADQRWPLQRLRWACGITATIALHRGALGEAPRFTDFPAWDELAAMAGRFPEVRRSAAERLVSEARDLQAELLQAA
jgi:hypothetical protein